MLVLLVIMMLVAPMLWRDVPLTLPEADNAGEQPDKDAKYSAIMDAMDALRNAQIENIALITEHKADQGGPRDRR